MADGQTAISVEWERKQVDNCQNCTHARDFGAITSITKYGIIPNPNSNLNTKMTVNAIAIHDTEK